VISVPRKNKFKTVSDETWKVSEEESRRAFKGKPPKVDYWITFRMPWMTKEGWENYIRRLNKVEYRDGRIKRQR